MANISDVSGTMSFVGNWTPKLKRKFVKVVNDRLDECFYYTHIEPVKKNSSTTTFWGAGRWDYDTNLRCLPHWLHKSVKSGYDKVPAVEKLAKEMATKSLSLEIDYTDSESGSDFIQKHKGTISPCQTPLPSEDVPEVMFWTLEYNGECYVNKKYTRENLAEYLGYSSCDFEVTEEEVLSIIKTKLPTVDLDWRPLIKKHLNEYPNAEDAEEEANDVVFDRFPNAEPFAVVDEPFIPSWEFIEGEFLKERKESK